MTYKEVATMVESIGLPFAYYQFPDNTEQSPPFICFLFETSNDFVADNSNYQKIRPLTIELYTDNKDFALESTVESTLITAGLPFTRSEDYIDSEHLYMVTYESQIIVTEGTT